MHLGRIQTRAIGMLLAATLCAACGGSSAALGPTVKVHAPAGLTGQDFPPPAGLGGWPTNQRYKSKGADPFRLTTAAPASSFGTDVDSASFSYIRWLLTRFDILPAFEAIRTDELLNYFDFRYPSPETGRPMSITTEIGPCPWKPEHRLALVGVRARPIDDSRTPPRRIVLVLDPATGHQAPYRLRVLKTAIRSFVDTLRDEDRLAVVIHGGGVVLPSTRASKRALIHDALEEIASDHEAVGPSGLPRAYALAREHFVRYGTNRVIVATDKDVASSLPRDDSERTAFLQLLERERQQGLLLSFLDLGDGALRDEETVASLVSRGGARYARVDSVQSARRVLAAEAGTPLEAVATDVRFQVAFNPAHVSAWKFIGYQNRDSSREQLDDEAKEGSELFAGDRFTVLYEIVPADRPLPLALFGEVPFPVSQLDFRAPRPLSTRGPEVFTVNVRYTLPGSSSSEVWSNAVVERRSGRRVRLAGAVAEFSRLLLDGESGRSRWRALTQRVDRLQPVNLADLNELSSLVARAARLMRRFVPQIKNHAYRRMPDGREWTVENLNIDLANVGSYCADTVRKWDTCQRDGQLYTWRAALEACQGLGPGWRLPTNEDWRQLARSFGGVRDDSVDEGAAAYAALASGGRSGFNAMFAGGRSPEGQYERVGAHGFYWTATESDWSHAWFYNFGGLKILNRHSDGEKRRALSVRCVR